MKRLQIVTWTVLYCTAMSWGFARAEDRSPPAGEPSVTIAGLLHGPLPVFRVSVVQPPPSRLGFVCTVSTRSSGSDTARWNRRVKCGPPL